ncbi:GTP cyclohydrolase I FolE [candidate division TA06 bacterium]|uniref:GTP cyclohydrolase 1 n=1 Tax=candidate division TA06 bacterium TaxID=2250710 RepID=A0A523UX49_UNCT6|nr:MAG: GTP cyclohydrolase I FolE [candidate division TA06 bacterium]
MRRRSVDKEKAKKAVRLLLEAIGEDPDREGLRETPQRVAEMYAEVFSGVGKDARRQIKAYSVKNQDEMIIVRDIPFYSVCEHHLLPFIGKAHVAYIPGDNRITGFANLVSTIEIIAKRPQLQERLTTEIADTLAEILKPLGILVVVEAEHLCLSMMGVKKPGALTVTSAMRGGMRKEATRAEAFSLIKSGR